MNHTNKVVRVCLILFMILTISGLHAAGSQEISPTPIERSATDAMGRTVTVREPIDKILVAGKAAIMPADALFLFPVAMQTEVMLAKTDQGLGDFFNLLKPEFASEARLGQQVGPEEIIAHGPDLVITKTSNYDSLAKLLEPFGIPVFVMDLETPEAWKQEIVQLGLLLGDQETPRRVITAYEEREAAIEHALADLDPQDRSTVLMMQGALADGITAFSVSPKQWIQTSLVQRAGGNPVWLDSDLASNAWRKVSFEQIAQWNPEHIFIISYKNPVSSILQQIERSGQWQALSAFGAGNISPTPADVINYFQSDSRWILALEWLAATLHPERFPGFDMEQHIRSFYHDFYGIQEGAVMDALVQAYRSSMER